MKFMDDDKLLAHLAQLGATKDNAYAALRISKNPLVPRYIDKMESRGDYFHIETTVDVIGEQLTLAAAAYTELEITNANPPLIDELRTWLGRTIETSVPYLWEDDTRMAAAAMTVPPHIIDPNNTLPFGTVWWTFPNDLTSDAHKLAMTNILLCQHPDTGITIYEFYRRKDTGAPVTHGLVIPAYAKFPDYIQEKKGLGTPWVHSVGCYLAMCSFLRSKAFKKTERRVHRAVRRDAKRRKQSIGERDTAYFVNLRPVEGQEKRKSEPTGKEAHYSCQFLVSGHFKPQWYPSRQAHDLIYIDPYMKGPKDKPIRTKIRRVNR